MKWNKFRNLRFCWWNRDYWRRKAGRPFGFGKRTQGVPAWVKTDRCGKVIKN